LVNLDRKDDKVMWILKRLKKNMIIMFH